MQRRGVPSRAASELLKSGIEPQGHSLPFRSPGQGFIEEFAPKVQPPARCRGEVLLVDDELLTPCRADAGARIVTFITKQISETECGQRGQARRRQVFPGPAPAIPGLGLDNRDRFTPLRQGSSRAHPCWTRANDQRAGGQAPGSPSDLSTSSYEAPSFSDTTKPSPDQFWTILL